ncbi:MAG: peptidoglycan DD-metalloendopeptidase family protein [Betaproteobacteria bacterium]|nr:peptidoglycan DD-metalloendopeptidase family protein [Betaproteobacteria bacterium]
MMAGRTEVLRCRGARPHAWLVLVATTLAIGACASAPRAPVIERAETAKAPAARPDKAATRTKAARDPDWRPKTYTVQKGDTLYTIALEHGLDYKELAEWNGIDNPNLIRVGQQLRIVQPASGATTSALKAPAAVEARPVGNTEMLKVEPRGAKFPYSDKALAQIQDAKPQAPKAEPEPKPAKPEPRPQPEDGDADEGLAWAWPAAGKLLADFSDKSKGVDIAGRAGQPVLASAPGRVVYSGSGLRGYGKLIIIKHNKTYLSAYAHNSQLLVKEGQSVAKGQKIAEMGNTDTDQVKLHFEIRRFGKPVDPLKHLPG